MKKRRDQIDPKRADRQRQIPTASHEQDRQREERQRNYDRFFQNNQRRKERGLPELSLVEFLARRYGLSKAQVIARKMHDAIYQHDRDDFDLYTRNPNED